MAERESSLRRGIRILLSLGSEEAARAGGLGVTRIAELTGFEKSQVSRALTALADHGLAERVPGERVYRLGWGCFALAARSVQPRLVQEAPPLLAGLVQELSETAHLSVLSGTQVLTLASEAPPHAIVSRDWVGRTVPAYCSSSGRALLIDSDRHTLERLFGTMAFQRRAPRSSTDVGELERRIARARELGYARAEDESEPGLVAVAAPVRDFAGRVVAAINVSAPDYRLRARLDLAGEAVREAAGRLSQALRAGAPESLAGAPARAPEALAGAS